MFEHRHQTRSDRQLPVWGARPQDRLKYNPGLSRSRQRVQRETPYPFYTRKLCRSCYQGQAELCLNFLKSSRRRFFAPNGILSYSQQARVHARAARGAPHFRVRSCVLAASQACRPAEIRTQLNNPSRCVFRSALNERAISFGLWCTAVIAANLQLAFLLLHNAGPVLTASRGSHPDLCMAIV